MNCSAKHAAMLATSVANGGGEAVYAVGLVDGRGIAVKIDGGGSRPGRW